MKNPPHRAIVSSSGEKLSSATSCSESELDLKESIPESHNSDHGVFCVVKHEHVLHAHPLHVHDDIIRAQPLHDGVHLAHPFADTIHQSTNLHDIVLQPELPCEGVLHAEPLPEHVQPRPLSREECKEQTYEEATTMFHAHIKVGSPPKAVLVNGLYVLIMESDEQWVPKKLLDNPDACMEYLFKQCKDGTIGQLSGAAFGQWYLYGNP